MTLCTATAPDGLKCDRTWPNCITPEECPAQGCFWRKWHSVPADKLRAAQPQGDLDYHPNLDGPGEPVGLAMHKDPA